MEITREKIFKDLIVVQKLGKKTPEEQIEIAKSLGDVAVPRSEREIKLQKQFRGEVPGLSHVTKGALFGHKKTLDWHANRCSDPDRASIIWIYAVKGSKGSLTSWINNYEAYKDLPEDVKNRCKDIKFTCGFYKGGYTDDPTFNVHHNKKDKFNLVYTNKGGLTGLYFPFNQIIDGIPKDLFDYLKDFVLQDKYRYDHYWEDGDVVVSEQWLTLHKRHEYDKMDERLMHRIGIR